MTTILVIFLVALLLALLITRPVARLGVRLGIVDIPSARKVHRQPVPRIGGLTIYLAFWGAFLPLAVPWLRDCSNLLHEIGLEPRLIPMAMGGTMVFVLGLCDDKYGLNAWFKLGVQAVAATIVYWGGIQIQTLGIPGLGTFNLGILALPATVFWILLVINAINLIDGLDGLAGGVCFFVCMVLVVLGVIGQNYIVVLLMAALAGATLGFLRYNFNPAVIFMGDGGSYFLGYMLASVSVLGAIKSQTAAALSIPVIALGVPLLDTIWATIRRFLLGRRIFQPDRDHFHHRLIKLGYSHRKAVLVLYGVTICCGAAALMLVNLRDERAALILGVVALAAILGIRRLGYMKYMKSSRLISWVRELGDDAGLSHERRSFLYEQMQINEATDLNELWRCTVCALEVLEFDMAAMYLNKKRQDSGCQMQDTGGRREEAEDSGFTFGCALTTCKDKSFRQMEREEGEADRREALALQSSVCNRLEVPDFVWMRSPLNDPRHRFQLRIEMALNSGEVQDLGILVLLKNGGQNGASDYTLKRVEHLRRNMVATLDEILGKRE